MSSTAQNTIQICIREARINAGHSSRSTAATIVPMSPETIGRHERGDIPLTPEVVVQYADGYDRPDIMLQYCANCPVGKRIHPQVEERDLTQAIIRMVNRAPKLVPMISRLSEIGDDNIIDDIEKPEFATIMEFLNDISKAHVDLLAWAMSRGIYKGRPASTGTTLV